MLRALEVQAGQQVLFEALQVVLRDYVGLVVDFDFGCAQENSLHADQNY